MISTHKKISRTVKSAAFALFTFAFVGFINFSSSSALAQQTPREWTILVYMNADNDLYRFGFLNMSQMEQIGSTEKVNVVVQMDHGDTSTPTTRYYVTKNPNPVSGKITSKVLQTLGETNMGDAKTLAEFLTWGVQTFPAKKYAVIIWNHGSGWEGISYDDNPRAYLTLPQVRTAMQTSLASLARQRGSARQAGKFDIINFDACLMSTLEVAYELKDVGQYLVGSQFNEPGEGEDYVKFLTPLVAQPQKTPRELSEIMVYQYATTYKDRSSINYAAVDLSRVHGFTSALNTTSQQIAGSPTKDGILLSFGQGSFDLITAFTQAQMASKSDLKTQQTIDQLIAAYGYPQDFQQNGPERNLAGGRVITRTYPGVVYYKTSAQSGAAQVELKLGAKNLYTATIPAQVFQYTVQRQAGRNLREARAFKESTSTFLRQGANPIVYHNAFPETSPLIADAYTFSTKGAHGMTLYSLAGVSASLRPNTKVLSRSILTEYKRLLFSTQGAPAWTSLFGF